MAFAISDPIGDAELILDAKLHNYGRSRVRGASLDLYLLDEGESASTPLLSIPVANMSSGERSFTESVTVQAPKLWSAEIPNLYKVLLVLKDGAGNNLEVLGTHFGFRSIEIRDQQLWVNGQSVLLKGANRHEIDPFHGRVVSLAAAKKPCLPA